MADAEDTLLRQVAEQKFEPCRELVDTLREWRRARDPGRLRAVLGEVRRVAEARTGNLMEPLVAALAGGATMGEITGVMRAAYGHPYDPFGALEPPL